MLATLQEAKDSSIGNVAGACTNSPEFLRLLNDATRQAMRRGDFKGTIVPIHICVKRGCVVWPRYCGEVRKLNLCNQHIPIRNVWYDFMEHDRTGCGWHHWRGGEPRMIQQANTWGYNDVFGDNRTIRAYAMVQADYGKTVTIFGVDNNNQPLQTNNGDGTWSEGIVITLAKPFGSTSVFVRRIDRVLKDTTQGNVLLYAYDAVNAVLEDLAVYQPSETNPDYVRHQLQTGCCTGQQGDCPTAQSAVALVKLRFVPVKVDTDLVLIQNLDALKALMQAIKFGEAGDLANKRAYEADAIRELNLELQDSQPVDQIPIEVEPFNGVPLGHMQTF